MPKTHAQRLSILLTALAIGAAPALAQSDKAAPQPELTPAEAWVITTIAGHARAKAAVMELQYQLQSRFLAADMDGDGRITSKDNDLIQREAQARARSGQITTWLSWDLDGDGQVTREEVTIAHRRHTAGPVRIGDISVLPTPAQRKEATEAYVAKSMEPDSNSDGIITFEEILAHAKKLASLHGLRYGNTRDRAFPNVFDANDDGVTEPGEFDAVVTRVLARIDADGDGRINADEAEAMKALLQAAHAVRRQR